MSGAGVVAAVLCAYGTPSIAGVRNSLDALGEHTDDLIASGATHLAGDYWKVWPAIFHVNWMLDEQRQNRVVWGLTHRSGPTEALWSAVPRRRIRVAVIPNDSKASIWLEKYGFTDLPTLEKRSTVDILGMD